MKQEGDPMINLLSKLLLDPQYPFSLIAYRADSEDKFIRTEHPVLKRATMLVIIIRDFMSNIF